MLSNKVYDALFFSQIGSVNDLLTPIKIILKIVYSNLSQSFNFENKSF